MTNLKGKTAVITGSARGMGRAFAHRLARAGANIAVVDINLRSAEEFDEMLTAPSVVDEIRRYGVEAVGVEANLADPADAARAVREIDEAFGQIDVLVNVAGGSLTGGAGRPIAQSTASLQPTADLPALIDLNLRTAVHMSQEVVPLMRRAGTGSIINIGAQSAVHVYETGELSLYASVKAALSQYTRYLAKEAGPWGVRANVIHPGIIMTSLNLAKREERNLGTDAQAAAIPMRRLGEPDDVARVVEFFASDLSEYVSGQAIVVDGGYTLLPV